MPDSNQAWRYVFVGSPILQEFSERVSHFSWPWFFFAASWLKWELEGTPPGKS